MATMRPRMLAFIVGIILTSGSIVAPSAHAATTPPMQQIAAGYDVSYGIADDGSLWQWGTDSAVPTRIGTDANWASISVGHGFCLAVKQDGTLWSWGNNWAGQLGLGSTTSTSTPVRVGTDSNWRTVSAGDYHAAALKTDGSMWMWGAMYDELNGGTPFSSKQPTRIGDSSDWAVLDSGGSHVLALRTDHSLWGFGVSYAGETGSSLSTSTPIRIGNETKWRKVSAGGCFSMAIAEDGSLWGWGSNSSGRAGLGGAAMTATPSRVGTSVGWADVDSGSFHAAAVRTDGSLWAWGDNAVSQLGFPDSGDVTSPVRVGTSNSWSEVDAGYEHTIARSADGGVWGWGDNGRGAIGLVGRSSGTPQQFASAGEWKTVSFHQFPSVFDELSAVGIRSDGTLWRLGCVEPAQIGTASTWATVAAGATHVLALMDDGSLWAFGPDDYGCLGNGPEVSVGTTSPVRVGDSQWKSIAAGSSHSLAVRADGTLWAWGSNESGKIGLPSAISSAHAPVQVGTADDWKLVEAGDGYSLAMKSDGSLWAFGYNQYGQLGYGSTASTSTPVRIDSTVPWRSVSAGYAHVVATKVDGTLWTWGYNGWGQLGDGTVDRTWELATPSPAQVGASTDWRDTGAGTYSSFAVKQDGSLWSWGANHNSLLGLGSTDSEVALPSRVSNGTAWTGRVEAGWDSASAAFQSDGSLHVWGSRFSVGLGVFWVVSEPLQVIQGRAPAGTGNTGSDNTSGNTSPPAATPPTSVTPTQAVSPTPTVEPVKTTLAKTTSKSVYVIKRSAGSAYWTTSAALKTVAGTPVSSKLVYLQRSTNGTKWTTSLKRKTNAAGKVSQRLRFRSKGTTYWRWYSPADGTYAAASAVKTKIVVR